MRDISGLINVLEDITGETEYASELAAQLVHGLSRSPGKKIVPPPHWEKLPAGFRDSLHSLSSSAAVIVNYLKIADMVLAFDGKPTKVPEISDLLGPLEATQLEIERYASSDGAQQLSAGLVSSELITAIEYVATLSSVWPPLSQSWPEE